MSGFELLDEETRTVPTAEIVDRPSAPNRHQPKVDRLATDGLVLALSALSKRMIIALATLFTAGTVASAWWLWMSFTDPNVYQLVSLGGYALFILSINWIVHVRRS